MKTICQEKLSVFFENKLKDNDTKYEKNMNQN